jgi:hypothetical protein
VVPSMSVRMAWIEGMGIGGTVEGKQA